MRVASRVATRPRPRSLLCSSNPKFTVRASSALHQSCISPITRVPQPTQSPIKFLSPCRHVSTTRSHSKNNSKLGDSQKKSEETITTKSLRATTLSIEECVKEIDRILLQAYSFNTFKPKSSAVLERGDCDAIINLFRRCSPVQRNDIFAWMSRNGRQRGAIWLIGEMLERVALNTSSRKESTPSNLTWPDLQALSRQFKVCDRLRIASVDTQASGTIDCDHAFNKHEFFRQGANNDYMLMTTIWSSLARLVLDTMTVSELEARQIMSSVLIVLAGMHRLDLMPKDIYHYKTSLIASNVQRPPILHMVSSRVLQSLSDAVWRDLQDEAVEMAVKQLGVSLREILKKPPGGRFRPVVRPLAPELWIEMFLWCCIEGGHAQAAVNIINMLREDLDNPWFAIRWNQPDVSSSSVGRIDWDRVELRTGGTVGRVEGYSHDDPFVTIPERTVSVEAVLAVVETLINSNIALTEIGSKSSDTQSTINRILTVVSFLEPHDLPKSYFDYLGTRLLQLGAFDMEVQPIVLKRWSQKLQEMSRLATVTPPYRQQNLELVSILAHGKAHAGIQHQALDGLVQIGDIHDSLELFNEIQETVDQSKVNDIAEFLEAEDESLVDQQKRGNELVGTPPVPDHTLANVMLQVQSSSDTLEYAHSHGQLPLYKVAGLLNLISDNDLVGLGQWMLYADELDGPLVPESAYGHSSFAAALYRFASVSEDVDLLNKVMNEAVHSRRPTSVRVLRSLINAQITLNNYESARTLLKQLAVAQGGGPSAMNIAHLAAHIVRLESVGRRAVAQSQLFDARVTLRKACSLLISLLRGQYDAKTSSFRSDQISLHRQQIAHILRIMSQVQGSVLQRVSQLYIINFKGGNQASLPVSVFNRLLAAVVETHSAQTGLEMWQLFCGLEKGLDSVDTNYVEYSDEDTAIELPPNDHMPLPASEEIASTDFEFRNSFFDNIITNAAVSSPDTGLESTQHGALENAPKSAFVEQAAALLSPIPLTHPNLHTVRLILRAAVRERQASPIPQRQDPKRDITRWAIATLKKHGLKAEVIAQEIATPLQELQGTYPEFKLEREADEDYETDSFSPLSSFDEDEGRIPARDVDAVFERLPTTVTRGKNGRGRSTGRKSALWSG